MLPAEDLQTGFQQVLAMLRQQKESRVLLLIDNMNQTVEEDPDLQELQKLTATVFITSRCSRLEGFETFAVAQPTAASGILIFRDNYGRMMSAEDKKTLNEIVKENLWCHTLTLRLLGKAARSRNWSVLELKKQLEDGGGLSYQEEKEKQSLRQVYRRMYSAVHLSSSQMRWVKIFAAMPYQSYSLDLLRRFFHGYEENGTDMSREAEELYTYGLLEKYEQGYSMHPFVAECMLPTCITEL